jgi:hypothetical protein
METEKHKSFVGDMVLVRIERDMGGTKILNDFPGVVYKIYADEPGNCVGLTLFQEGQPTRYGKIPYSELPQHNCWSELNRREKINAAVQG